jgi:hypothetical protein
MCATKELPRDLDPVPNHFALTMLANRSHRLNRALETIEGMLRSSSFDNEMPCRIRCRRPRTSP